MTATEPARAPSRASGLLFGLGLGGFVDGIVLHQILQWHHIVSDVDRYPVTTVAGLEINTLSDGLFHRYNDQPPTTSSAPKTRNPTSHDTGPPRSSRTWCTPSRSGLAAMHGAAGARSSDRTSSPRTPATSATRTSDGDHR